MRVLDQALTLSSLVARDSAEPPWTSLSSSVSGRVASVAREAFILTQTRLSSRKAYFISHAHGLPSSFQLHSSLESSPFPTFCLFSEQVKDWKVNLLLIFFGGQWSSF